MVAGAQAWAWRPEGKCAPGSQLGQRAMGKVLDFILRSGLPDLHFKDHSGCCTEKWFQGKEWKPRDAPCRPVVKKPPSRAGKPFPPPGGLPDPGLNPCLSLFFLIIYFISWRLITLQYCSGFCHTLAWISHGFTCVPHPDPPSHLPLHPIPLGLPSAPALSTCLMHPTWAGDLFHPR